MVGLSFSERDSSPLPTMARILIIDDNAELRSMLRIALAGAGHQIEEAENGVVGLQRYKERPFDLIITDILMPEKEGFETIHELRAADPHVRIVAISGGLPNAHFDPLPLASLLGARRVLAKPFDIGELLNVVQEVLNEPLASKSTPR